MLLPGHISWLRHRSALLLIPGLIIALCGCALSGNGASPTPTAAPSTSSNAHTSEPTLAAPVRGSYAALGASETYGIGAEPHTDGYAYLVAKALHAKHFVDVGIPGTTLNQGYDTELTSALAIRPSLCTVFFGVNDIRAGVSRDGFAQDLHDLVVTLRRAHAQVLIVGIPDLAKVPAVAHLHVVGLSGELAAWNAGMKRVARETGAHFLDLTAYNAELASHPQYVARDGLHPSNSGHARIAQVVLQTIRKAALWRNP